MNPASAALVGGILGVAAGWPVARVVDRFAPPAARRRAVALTAATGGASALAAAAIATRTDGMPSGWGGSVAASVLVALAFLALAALSVALTVIDVEVRRLPDAIVLPAYPLAAALLVAAGVVAGDGGAVVRAAVGLVALGGFYLVLRLVRPGAMGGGDVKLAGLLGLYLGWLGVAELVVGAVAAFVFGGLAATAILLTRGRGLRRGASIAFGPWMILGAWFGVVAGPAVAFGYLGILLAA